MKNRQIKSLNYLRSADERPHIQKILDTNFKALINIGAKYYYLDSEYPVNKLSKYFNFADKKGLGINIGNELTNYIYTPKDFLNRICPIDHERLIKYKGIEIITSEPYSDTEKAIKMTTNFMDSIKPIIAVAHTNTRFSLYYPMNTTPIFISKLCDIKLFYEFIERYTIEAEKLQNAQFLDIEIKNNHKDIKQDFYSMLIPDLNKIKEDYTHG